MPALPTRTHQKSSFPIVSSLVPYLSARPALVMTNADNEKANSVFTGKAAGNHHSPKQLGIHQII